MTKVEKIKARLCSMDRLQWRRTSQGFEARDREAVKLGQDLAPMDRGNGEERATVSGSYHLRKIKPSVDS